MWRPGSPIQTEADGIRYTSTLDDVDWPVLVRTLEEDNFHNGRTVDQMEDSFRNSSFCVLAYLGERCIGNTRVLSDGICNAYVVDVWTHSSLRRRGIGRRMMELVLERLPGQHVYLFTDEPAFYRALGFESQPEGMGMVVGAWLQNRPGPG